MSQKVIRVSPKRRVERVRADVNHNIATSANDLDLHVCEDAKTLVRIKANLQVVQRSNFSTQESQLHSIVIGVNPGGNKLITPSYGQALDQDTLDQELIKINGAIIGRSASDPGTGEQIARYEIDSKAMRKLKAGDTIGLSDIVDTQTGLSGLIGNVYMWFKE